MISILMPVFNEEKTINTIISRVLDQPFELELIIVDDCSTDRTRDILKTIDDPRVRIFYREQNGGKGAALKDAAQHIRGEYCIIQDADLEYDPVEYPNLLELLRDDKADVVYGSRFLYRTRIFYFYNYLGNKIVNLFANIFFNTTFTDLETCYKAFRAEVIKDMPFRSKSFGFEVEFTAHVIKKKCRVYEVPISYYGRTYDEGKKITWRDGVIALYWVLYCRFFEKR